MKYLSKLLTTFLVAAALYESPLVVDHALARPDPPIAPVCWIVVLTLTVGGVMIYGIYRCCQALDQQAPPPPDEIPPQVTDELPPPGPGQVHPLPPLKLQLQLFGAPIVGQHADTGITFRSGTNWQSDYSFTAIPGGPSGLMIVASDANGIPLTTNFARAVTTANGNWAVFDFTGLPPVATNQVQARFFRLVGQ